MIGPVTSESARHHATLWRGKKPWHWAALKSGKFGANVKRKRINSHNWWFHMTPVHVTRSNESWAIGLCAGRHMVYVLLHR